MTLIQKLTGAVRSADRVYEDVGGSSRHYAADCLMPALAELGLAIVEAADLASLTIQRDAAEALAREAKVSAWAIGVVAKACDEGQAAAIRDRDAAHQMVAECHAAMTIVVDWLEARKDSSAPAIREAINKATPIAGRWCLASERDEALAQRDDAEGRFQKAWGVAIGSNTRANVSEAAARALGADFTRVLRECAATQAQRDEALAILRDLVVSWDGVDDFDCGAIVDRASKLVGGGE